MSDDHAIIEADAVAITEKSDAGGDMSVIIGDIIQRNPTAENLERLLKIWEHNEAIKAKHTYSEARKILRADLPPVIPHNRKGPNDNYSYSDLMNIMSIVEPALRKHGFEWGWKTQMDGRMIIVRFELTYGGHTDYAEQPSPPSRPNKLQSEAQAIQATVTYLKRQTMLSLLGLVTAEVSDTDDDGTTHTPEGSDSSVDAARNMRVMTKLRKDKGITVDEAEQYIGRPVTEWAAADIARIPAWLDYRQKACKS